MNTSNFLDANVWLALLWTGHIHFEKALRWWQAAQEEQFLFCRFTQITVLRLLTTQQVMGSDVKTMAGAWEAWDVTRPDSRIVCLPEPDGLETEFRSSSRLESASPKLWADSYLLAFASLAGVRLVTFDRALAARSSNALVL